MSDDEPDIADCRGPDADVLRVDRRLRVLEALSDVGMDITRVLRDDVVTHHRAQAGTLRDGHGDKLRPDVVAAIASAPRPANPALAFSLLSRAIRLTITLEGRVHEELRDLRAGVARERAQSAEWGPDRRAERRASAGAARSATPADREAASGIIAGRLREIVVEAAEREHGDVEKLDEIEFALDERLDRDPAYADLTDKPLEAAVRRLCADIGLNPDWSLWVGDGWAPRQRYFRPRRSAVPPSGLQPAPELAAVQGPSPEARRPRLE